MYVTEGLGLPGESDEVRRLRERSDAVVRELAARAADPATRSQVEIVSGLAGLVSHLRRIEPHATRSAWVMQPAYAYDPEDPGVDLTREARDRGVETQLMTRPGTVRTHPLLPSIFPTTMLGPVFLRAMVIDERHATVGGPDDALGNRTSFYTTVPELVGSVAELWRDTVPLCRPILPPGARPPLSERQLSVSRLLCVGEKDTVIARQLGLSARTVEREVSVILSVLGAHSRAEAVLLMRGRGVNGGYPAAGRHRQPGQPGRPVSSRITRRITR